MHRFGRTVFEFICLVLIGSVVGFSVNAARAKTIKPTQNYFDLKIDVPTDKGNVAKTPSDAGNSTTAHDANKSTGDTTGVRKVHGFVAINATEAYELYNDPKRESGLYVFVDARSDERFAEGHIPGAVQCDHYFLTKYLDRTLEQVKGAAKVIVYCNGGDCEDSGLVCKDLFESDIPYESLLLFDEGWAEWSKRGYPKEIGSGNPASEETSSAADSSEADSSSADDSSDTSSEESDE